MLVRRLIFTPDPQGQRDFRLCYEAFRGRDPQKCTGQERQYLAQIQRALESISEPIGEVRVEDPFDVRMRELVDAGGTIDIPVKAFEKLETFVDEAPFMAGIAVAVEDLKERMTGADKVDVEREKPVVISPPD